MKAGRLRVARRAHYDRRMTDPRAFHDGREDGLVALESLDLLTLSGAMTIAKMGRELGLS